MSLLLAASVERAGDDHVTIRLEWDGPPPHDRVEVRAAPSPDALATAPVVAEVNGTDHATIRGSPTGERRYFEIRVPGGGGIVTAERLVPLEGALNFRDLGGYRTVENRTVRWGRVFRSDRLSGLTAGDLEILAGLGLRVVHDLRWPFERARDPSRLPDDVVVREHTIGEDRVEQPDLVDMVIAGEVRSFSIDQMMDAYERMAIDHGTAFAVLLGHLASDDGLPALFHCTAGKDRTGIAAALLLGALGVPEETVLDDYELSTRFRTARRMEQLRPTLEAAGVDVDAVRPLFSALRPVLANTLQRLHDDFGSIEGYLVDHAGMHEDVLTRLRERLLD
jgi:protein-tyrosine phosphatase